MEPEDQQQEKVDPMKYMEMQAQYLRMLAQYYDSETGEKREEEGDVEPDQQDSRARSPVFDSKSPDSEELEEVKKEEEPSPPESRQPVVFSQSHDELPIRGLPKSFEETLDSEIRKDPPSLPSFEPSPRSDAKPAKKVIQSSPQTPSLREEMQQDRTDPPKPQRAFLKRGQGQLCVVRSQSMPSGQKAETANPDIEKPGREPLGDAGLSFSEDSKESEPDEDSLSYREEVARLTATLKELQREQLRLKGDKERRERKVKELESLKLEIQREKQQLLKDFEDWKAAEHNKLRKERKQTETAPRLSKAKREEIEKLKAVAKKLEEEAKTREARYKQQIAKLQAELQEAKAARTSTAEIPPTQVDEIEPSSVPGESVPVSKTVGPDGKVITVHSDGKKEILFPNGVRKEVFPDDFTVIYFTNNDIKQTFPDGKIVYYFADAQTTQTTFPDGLQIFKFTNGQSEKHFTDNTKEITFPDGTVKCIFPDGEEESIFPDGTVQKVDVNGVKYIDFVNGQKDTIYPDGTKVREFADGRIKKILPSGKVVES